VLSSPVYFASFSAQLKTVIDRFQANFSRKYTLKHRDDKVRKGYLIFTAGGLNKQMISSMELSGKFFFLSCNAVLSETIYALDTDTTCVKDREELLVNAYDSGYRAAANVETIVN
jgi:multimeric flavodoxin WrbA